MPSFPRRGEVWLVEFPDDPKSRPALIVSPDGRNELANSVLAVPVTTNLRPAPTHVLLPAGQGELAHDSMLPLRERQLSAQVAPESRAARRRDQPRADARHRALDAPMFGITA